MDQNKTDFLYLLSCFLNGETPESRAYDWEALYPLADINDVAAVLYHGITQLDEACRPAPHRLAYFKKSMALAVQQYAEKAEALHYLEELFTVQAIDFLPVKGAVVSAYYPIREFRTSGDIDLIVREGSMDSVFSLFEQDDAIRVRSYHAGTITAKVMDALVEIHNDADVENSYFADIFGMAQPHGNRYQLDADLHLLYILCHLVKHLSYRGAGIRMLMDLDVMIRAMKPFDEARFYALAGAAGVEKSARLLFSLLRLWFDTPGIETQLLQGREEVVEKLAEVLIDGGSFGGELSAVPVQYVRSQLARSSTLSLHAKIHVALRMAFPDRAYLKRLYRYYEKHSFLYPVAVLNRLLDSLFRRRNNARKALRQIMNGSEASRLQLEVMEELGIDQR